MPRQQLRTRPGAPTLYLLDERHHDDASTDDNINIAVALFREGVVLAGVEGYEGGAKYDVYERRFISDRAEATPSEGTRIGEYPRLAKALLAKELPVIGVDCEGLCDLLFEATLGDPRADLGTFSPQQDRTLHFVRTLADEAQRRSLRGDLLLNCGSRHNDRIEKLVRDTETPLPDGWPDWNYVRIRSELYPTAPSADGPGAPGAA